LALGPFPRSRALDAHALMFHVQAICRKAPMALV
jgi:hypothetical protein